MSVIEPLVLSLDSERLEIGDLVVEVDGPEIAHHQVLGVWTTSLDR
jgi:hypothetical protein